MSSGTAEIVDLYERLPEAKREEVADFARFLLSRVDAAAGASEEDGDAAWERIIADPRPRPKLEAFLKASREEGGVEPLDLDKLR